MKKKKKKKMLWSNPDSNICFQNIINFLKYTIYSIQIKNNRVEFNNNYHIKSIQSTEKRSKLLIFFPIICYLLFQIIIQLKHTLSLFKYINASVVNITINLQSYINNTIKSSHLSN